MRILFWLFIGFDKHETSEHLLVSVIEQLCLAGHDVHILQKYTGGDLPSIPGSLSRYSVTAEVVPFKAAKKGNLAARYFKELKYVKSCMKRIDKGYDAVFIQSNTVAGFAVRTIRKKLPDAIITFNVQDIFPFNAVYSGKLKQKSWLFKILSGLQRNGYKNSDHIITISEDMKDTLISDGVNKDKIDVIYNWSYQDDVYNEKSFSREAVSHIYQKDFFKVVYAGNVGVMQNVDVIIEAAKCLKEENNIWFYIIGNGLYRENLIAKANSYGITNISFLPMQPAELAPSIYGLADVNIIPLKKEVFRTALPSKTATCLACQKPIIFVMGTDCVFAKHVINETGCLLVDSDDSQRLASSIKDIVDRKLTVETKLFFEENMSKTRNSLKYTEIITRRPKSD